MKKIIVCLLSVCCILFSTSCSKEDKASLSGTTWKYQSSDYYYDITLTFLSESMFTMTEYEYDDGERYVYNGTYTYNPPVVTLTSEGDTMVGTVNGNTMIIDGMLFVKH